MQIKKHDFLNNKIFEQDLGLIKTWMDDDRFISKVHLSHRKAEDVICFLALLPQREFTFEELLTYTQHGNRMKQYKSEMEDASFFQRVLFRIITWLPDKDTLNAKILKEALDALVDCKIIRTKATNEGDTYLISYPFILLYEAIELDIFAIAMRKMILYTLADNLCNVFDNMEKEDKVAAKKWLNLLPKVEEAFEKDDITQRWRLFEITDRVQKAYKCTEEHTKILPYLEAELAFYSANEKEWNDIHEAVIYSKFADVYCTLNNKKKAIEYIDKAYLSFTKSEIDAQKMSDFVAVREGIYQHFKVKMK